MAIKESDWIKCRERKPSEPGLYKRQLGGLHGWQFWTGQHWGIWRATKPTCENPQFLTKSQYQTGHWKGVIA